MPENWSREIITQISLATYVQPGAGAVVHKDRSFHGLVLNGKGRKVDYFFFDGTELKTGEYHLFYLPKGSSYSLMVQEQGEGCWAINFDLLESRERMPFSVQMPKSEQMAECFKSAVAAFQKSDIQWELVIRKNLYEILLLLNREIQKKYLPSRKAALLSPALERMEAGYDSRELSVKGLAELCGISEAYFRRVFTEKFGVSPKEYLIGRRMDYAKKLLLSRQFSVGEVALMCGYAEPCHFSREFKRRVGVPPEQYEKGATA